MTYEEAKFILRHGSAEGLQRYLEAITVIENEINRQQAEIDDLKRDAIPKLQYSLTRANKYGVDADKENEQLKAEIERLQKKYIHNAMDLKPLIKETIKSEARREFAERLKQHSYIVSDESVNGIILYQHCVGVNQIDSLLAEMESESNV